MYGFQAAMAFPWTDYAGETLTECGAALGEEIIASADEDIL